MSLHAGHQLELCRAAEAKQDPSLLVSTTAPPLVLPIWLLLSIWEFRIFFFVLFCFVFIFLSLKIQLRASWMLGKWLYYVAKPPALPTF